MADCGVLMSRREHKNNTEVNKCFGHRVGFDSMVGRPARLVGNHGISGGQPWVQ